MPSVPYPELRSESVRYLIVTIVDCSRVLVSLVLVLSSLAHVLALTVLCVQTAVICSVAQIAFHVLSRVLFSRKLTEDNFLARGCALHRMAHLASRVLTDAINHTKRSWNS